MDMLEVQRDITSVPQAEIEELFRNIVVRLPTSFITSHEVFAAPFIEAGLFSWKSYENFRQGNRNQCQKAAVPNGVNHASRKPQSFISKRLINIAKNLPSDRSSFNVSLLWETDQTYLRDYPPQENPNVRHRYLELAESKLDLETALSSRRRRILRVLQGNEREIIKNNGTTKVSKPTTRGGRRNGRRTLTNRDYATIFNIEFKTFLNMATQFSRYMSVVKQFGIGCLNGLGDYSRSHTDWKDLTKNEFYVLLIYISKYRQDWVKLVVSENVNAAKELAKTMLRAGMPIAALMEGRSTLTSIIIKYIAVMDGGRIHSRQEIDRTWEERWEGKCNWRNEPALSKLPDDTLRNLEKEAEKLYRKVNSSHTDAIDNGQTTQTTETPSCPLLADQAESSTDSDDSSGGTAGQFNPARHRDPAVDTGRTGNLSTQQDEDQPNDVGFRDANSLAVLSHLEHAESGSAGNNVLGEQEHCQNLHYDIVNPPDGQFNPVSATFQRGSPSSRVVAVGFVTTGVGTLNNGVSDHFNTEQNPLPPSLDTLATACSSPEPRTHVERERVWTDNQGSVLTNTLGQTYPVLSASYNHSQSSTITHNSESNPINARENVNNATYVTQNNNVLGTSGYDMSSALSDIDLWDLSAFEKNAEMINSRIEWDLWGKSVGYQV